MKTTIRLIAAAAVAAACTAPALAAVGVSVNVGEPGFFGSLDIGGYPPPQTVYARPVVIQRGPDYVDQPLYLHVPPGREANWRRYCREYNACGRPVFFVRDDWYRNVYAPRYHAEHARGGDDRGRPQPDERRGDDRRDRGRDDRGDRNDRGDRRD